MSETLIGPPLADDARAFQIRIINFFSAGQRMLARDLKILFDDNGVEIPFPQVVVHKGD